MKHILKLIVITTLIFGPAIAADDHNHKIIPGPQGGKLLESEPQHAEFFVLSNKKASVTFYDDAMKPVAIKSQEVKITVEAKSGKVALELEKVGDSFVSKTTLPEGDGYRVVIQIKNDAASKPQNFRVDYHTEICKECNRAEYACSCDHGKEGAHTGHKH